MQPKLAVSRPSDPLEREADRTADRVMRMAQPSSLAAPPPPATPPQVQRASSSDARVQRFGGGTPAVAADVKSEIQRATTGGQGLSSEVRGFMEPRLGADLGAVRVHADEGAASLSNHLSARAFTYGNHVFFGRDQYQPGTHEGRHLLAHELTHTIQQGAAVQRTPAPARVSTPGSTPDVQRLGVGDALDYFADKAHHVPGFRMLTLVLGFNPINRAGVPRTAANLLRAVIEMVPGGALITQVLDTHGVVTAAAEWVERRLATLGDIGGGIVEALRLFIASLRWSDIFDLGGVWQRAKAIFTEPIGQLIAFGAGVTGEILDLVKQTVLRPLAALAEGTAGYDLLRAILGQDPITGAPVARTADTLIGGFMKLIGQEEIWQNIKRGNAVGRAYAWFQGALAGLMGFVRSIPGRIVATLRSLTFPDLVSLTGAFRKVGAAFLGLAAEFGSWALNQVVHLLEILFSVVAPAVLPYIAKAKAAFHTIIRNPIAFVGNLVAAAKLGFEQFAGNILSHLKDALIKWITGPLGEAGVHIPKSFSLTEILKLVLSVLGLTWGAIRTKLVKIIPDPILAGLETTATILVTLVTQGPAAAWEQIKGELTELKDQLIGQVSSMIQTEVVKAAVTKLVSMLNPAGAVIQAIIAIHKTVTFFIEKAKQIGAVVASFIDSISAIAAGQVGGAAKKVEQTLADTLTVVLVFLAKFAGLGGIPEKLVGIVKKIRAPIDRGLDKIVAWLGAMLSKLVASAKEGVRKLLEWWRTKVPIRGGDTPHTLMFEGDRSSARLVVKSAPTEPVRFITEAADTAKVSDADRATPIATTKGHAERIDALRTALTKVDNNPAAAAAGPVRAQADADSKALDDEMVKLGRHVGDTLAVWKVTDEEVVGLSIARGSFTVEQKRAIANEDTRIDPTQKNLRLNKDGALINVAQGIARRHVVSAHDIGEHYMHVLNKKKASVAKLLLEERGSLPEARKPVPKPLSPDAIKKAAIARYDVFFGYAKNIFLGDSRENSSIQEHLDPKHPEMAGAKLGDHVARIKRSFALDDSFKETPVKSE